jgi:hypothetical protein
VLIATAVWMVSTSAEIISSEDTEPVTSLRIAMSSQTTAVPASRPASGLTRSVTTMYAPNGSPTDSAMFQAAVQTSRLGCGSSRCPEGAGMRMSICAGDASRRVIRR